MVKQKVHKLSDGRNLLLQITNPRSIRLAPLSPDNEITEDGTIIGIEYPKDNFSVAVNGTVEVDNSGKYKISKIERSEDPTSSGYQLIIHQLTKSSQLIMPMLGGNRQFYRWNKNFCNCFIGTEFIGDYGSSIYLLYRWEGSKSFTEFEESLSSHSWYTGSWEPDKYHSMYEFCIPTGNTDIEEVISGNYSYISISGKERILAFHGSTDESKLAKILRRDPELREELITELSLKDRVQLPEDAELFSAFIIENEIYLDKYVILDKNEANDKAEQSDHPGVW